MDIEQTLETQRHRLLRILAGLALLLGVLALGPVSRSFSEWTLGFVGSVLSRAEAAARYLVITRAYLMVDRQDLGIERSQIDKSFPQDLASDDPYISLSECQTRLRILRAVLSDLPRHALRLLHRIAKQSRRHASRNTPDFDMCLSVSWPNERRAAHDIERPPDKTQLSSRLSSLCFSPLPACRVGGVGS